MLLQKRITLSRSLLKDQIGFGKKIFLIHSNHPRFLRDNKALFTCFCWAARITSQTTHFGPELLLFFAELTILKP
jgi:hypothetical protein